MHNAPTFMTVAEVARALRCTAKTIRKLIRCNQLAAEKVARKWLIPKTEIQRLQHDALGRFYLDKFGGIDRASEQMTIPFGGLRPADARNPPKDDKDD